LLVKGLFPNGSEGKKFGDGVDRWFGGVGNRERKGEDKGIEGAPFEDVVL